MSLDCARGILWLGMTLCLAMPTGAQEALDSLRGERVRATFEQGSDTWEVIGSLTETEGKGLTMERDGHPLPIPRSALSRVEVPRGRSPGRGALRGAGIGAAAGFVGYKLYADWRNRNDTYNTTFAVLIGAPAGTLLGAVIGAAIGVEEWTTVWVAPDATGSRAAGGVQLELPPGMNGGSWR